ncbi:MAG: DUF1476 domain-containing protein [Proteobacteria bacterium]|nr:DUF1476 domain-containing protein [Pseudomonadota bacterium]
MSNAFEDRRSAFENKFKLDQETEFKVRNRRNKLLGLWLAEKMGITASDSENYAKDVVMSDLDEPGDEDVIRKVMKDIGERGANISEDDVREKHLELFGVAAEEITAD